MSGAIGSLSYSLWKAVHSDSSVYGLYALFLLFAAVFALMSRRRESVHPVAGFLQWALPCPRYEVKKEEPC